jgi:hypothetical protein
VLIVGFLLALGAVVMAIADVHGSSFVGVLGVLAVGGGLAGLFVHTRRQKAEAEKEPEMPRRLNIYREYSCRIERPLVDKLLKMGTHLREQLEGRPYTVDWSSYKKYNDMAQQSLQEGDLLSSFREQCRALLGLAQCFNRNRPREEGFRPKWESTAEA